MAWFLFLDESGTDQRESPYEVLAGLAVEDRILWKLIQEIKDTQETHFGIRLFDAYGKEAKAQKLLKKKTFQHAAQFHALPQARQQVLNAPNNRCIYANQALTDGANISGDMLTALALSKLDYVKDVLRICLKYKATAFASIVPKNAPRPQESLLRKDYVFLFERYFHFLNRHEPDSMGMIVFDETEKKQSQRLLEQMEGYFLRTNNGRTRSRLLIPEPLFVHSDLTTMIQMADLVAYIISWSIRLNNMNEPARAELDPFADIVCKLRYKAETPGGYPTWGFKLVQTLESSDI